MSSLPTSIPIHPDFRMIFLANRPGFPFLGNDFFAAMGESVLHKCVVSAEVDMLVCVCVCACVRLSSILSYQ